MGAAASDGGGGADDEEVQRAERVLSSGERAALHAVRDACTSGIVSREQFEARTLSPAGSRLSSLPASAAAAATAHATRRNHGAT